MQLAHHDHAFEIEIGRLVVRWVLRLVVWCPPVLLLGLFPFTGTLGISAPTSRQVSLLHPSCSVIQPLFGAATDEGFFQHAAKDRRLEDYEACCDFPPVDIIFDRKVLTLTSELPIIQIASQASVTPRRCRSLFPAGGSSRLLSP